MAEKKDNIIEFPKILKERIGTKWRVKEIEALQKYLRECDEDMTTLLDQLDIINKELLVLNKEYEAILNDVMSMPDGEDKDDIINGMKKGYELYEKVRREHGEGKANLFVPLIHNVLGLANLKYLQSALIGQSDVNWTFSASKAFAKSRIQKDIDVVIDLQEKEITQIRNRILDLRQSEKDVPELTRFINEAEDLVEDANNNIMAIKLSPTDATKNLPSELTNDFPNFCSHSKILFTMNILKMKEKFKMNLELQQMTQELQI